MMTTNRKIINIITAGFVIFMLITTSHASIAPKRLPMTWGNNADSKAFQDGKEWCERQGKEKTCIPFNNASNVDLHFYVTIPHDDYNQNALVRSGTITGVMIPDTKFDIDPTLKYINVRVENTNNKKIIFNGVAKNFVGIKCQKLATSSYSCKPWGM